MKRKDIFQMITLESIKNNEEINELVSGSQKQLNALGYML